MNVRETTPGQYIACTRCRRGPATTVLRPIVLSDGTYYIPSVCDACLQNLNLEWTISH